MCAPSSAIHHRDPPGLCFEIVCLSNTSDSTALNHLLTVFASWSFFFFFSAFAVQGGEKLQVHRKQEEAFANLIYILKKKQLISNHSLQARI